MDKTAIPGVMYVDRPYWDSFRMPEVKETLKIIKESEG